MQAAFDQQQYKKVVITIQVEDQPGHVYTFPKVEDIEVSVEREYDDAKIEQFPTAFPMVTKTMDFTLKLKALPDKENHHLIVMAETKPSDQI